MANKLLVSILIVVGMLALLTIGGIMLLKPKEKVSFEFKEIFKPIKNSLVDSGYGHNSKIKVSVLPCQKIITESGEVYTNGACE